MRFHRFLCSMGTFANSGFYGQLISTDNGFHGRCVFISFYVLYVTYFHQFGALWVTHSHQWQILWAMRFYQCWFLSGDECWPIGGLKLTHFWQIGVLHGKSWSVFRFHGQCVFINHCVLRAMHSFLPILGSMGDPFPSVTSTGDVVLSTLVSIGWYFGGSFCLLRVKQFGQFGVHYVTRFWVWWAMCSHQCWILFAVRFPPFFYSTGKQFSANLGFRMWYNFVNFSLLRTMHFHQFLCPVGDQFLLILRLDGGEFLPI